MREIIDLLATLLLQTTFDAGRSGAISLDTLRHTYQRDKLSGSTVADSVRAFTPPHLLEKLTLCLHPLLEDFTALEGDWIGNGLAQLMGGAQGLTLTEFAQVIVRAAATLGPEQAVQILFAWIDGKPLVYRTKVLLGGVAVDQTLELQEGIQITPLPRSTDELLVHLPPHSTMFHGYHNFLGGVVLSVDCQVKPALYKPQANDLPRNNSKRTMATGQLAGLSLDTFFQALSLASNNSISPKLSWQDFGDLKEFNPGFGNGMSWTTVPGTFDPPFMRPTVNLSQENLMQAKGIYLDLQANARNKREIRTALDRWMKSKLSTMILPGRSIPDRSLPDCFIELRVALDALYLKNITGELKFRLATYVAWHLGSDFLERRQYHATISRMYDLASKAVHTGEIKNTPETLDVLTVTQDLCRQGILKRLKEENEPNWKEMILGVGP